MNARVERPLRLSHLFLSVPFAQGRQVNKTKKREKRILTMPASMMSPTRIITVFSLVALCIISFTVLFGSHNNLDTLTRDTQVHDSPFPLPKSNVIHERRALPHARAATSDPASESNPTPSQSAAATQASSQPFSSPSPSFSSRPSATDDNSSSAPSSTVEATSNIPNNPATTLANNPITQTSRSSGTVPTEPGAVGVTFSIVGILGGLAVIMGVLTLLRRRRRARRGRYAIEDEEFFEKYPNPDFNEPVPHLPPGFGSGSAAASITDVNMNAAPADAYPDRAFTTVSPTMTLSSTRSTMALLTHPYSTNTSGPPVTAPRPFAGRVQEMVTTDSYYGPNSAGVGAGSMGYAQ
ncbi:hypothetical protein BGY98DRAFT_980288 [Russula aff. rugulosa BPL654]|nr:hypothetical protein BGY98DRAFT_980288 [Russula aff. rugulosa BPL654]